VSAPRLFLFDDRRARRWAPFTLTRPAGELLFGCLTARERAERFFGVPCLAHMSRAALAGFDEPDACPVASAGDLGTEGTRIMLSSRAVPPSSRFDLPGVPTLLTIGGEAVGCVLPDGAPVPSEAWLKDPSGEAFDGARVDLDGIVLGWPWDLVAGNAARTAADIAALWPEDHEPERVLRIGSGAISLGEGAEIEPGTHVDTRAGAVRLARGARVEGPARLVGPLYVGPDSTVLGGSVGGCSIGPSCKVRGELSESVLVGYANKAHDGYIGHALIGQWVNLGALTTNSDLKNNYRPVKVWTLDGEVDTHALKVGCFLGDHVKTGIGTVLNTGTVIGAGSNVFGGIMPPSVVPPFSWGTGPDLRDHRLDKFLETTELAMDRRVRTLTPGVRRILQQAWRDTAGRRT
jgi:UDP-N-acetylglucosamine diphosphorylase/glucosamine-1-phosphate N-acetyltransferase